MIDIFIYLKRLNIQLCTTCWPSELTFLTNLSNFWILFLKPAILTSALFKLLLRVKAERQVLLFSFLLFLCVSLNLLLRRACSHLKHN